MQYRISDVARVLGVTPNALHFFEKENIITVQKGQNGYRSYSISDVFRLLSYEKYRSMGYPIKAIRAQFTNGADDRAGILQRVEAQKQEALDKAAYYARLAEAIEAHLVDMRKIDTLLGQYECIESADMLFLFDEKGGWISNHKASQMILRQWVAALPVVRLAFLHFGLQPSLLPKSKEGGTLGYMVEEALAKELHLPASLHVHRQPASSCLHTIVATDDRFLENPASAFHDIYEEAARRGVTPCGPAWGTILLVEVETDGCLRPYHSLFLPVKL